MTRNRGDNVAVVAKAVELVRAGKASLLMKGSLHSALYAHSPAQNQPVRA